MSATRDSLKEARGESCVEHACFVENKEITGEGVIFVVGEAARKRIILKETVNSACGSSRGFG